MRTEQEPKPMPCGTYHSCFDCIHFYGLSDGCSHMRKMSEEEYDAHVQSLYNNDTSGQVGRPA